MILHLVNLTSTATWRAPLDELIPIGPVKVAIHLPSRTGARSARLLVANRTSPVAVSQGQATVDIESILDHEVLVIE